MLYCGRCQIAAYHVSNEFSIQNLKHAALMHGRKVLLSDISAIIQVTLSELFLISLETRFISSLSSGFHNLLAFNFIIFNR